MCLPACSSRFPNNLSERGREEGEKRGREGEKSLSHLFKVAQSNDISNISDNDVPQPDTAAASADTHTHSYIQLFFNSYPVYRLNRTFPLMLMLVPESVIDLS